MLVQGTFADLRSKECAIDEIVHGPFEQKIGKVFEFVAESGWEIPGLQYLYLIE